MVYDLVVRAAYTIHSDTSQASSIPNTKTAPHQKINRRSHGGALVAGAPPGRIKFLGGVIHRGKL